jgi:hypothetical protein
MIHLLETQIDSIMSSHIDTLVVQTMRSYNSTASRLAMPAITSQIENLSDELSERSHELGALQEALNGIATSMVVPDDSFAAFGEENPSSSQHSKRGDDAYLMKELEALLATDSDENDDADEDEKMNEEREEAAQTSPMATSTKKAAIMTTTKTTKTKPTNIPLVESLVPAVVVVDNSNNNHNNNNHEDSGETKTTTRVLVDDL